MKTFCSAVTACIHPTGRSSLLPFSLPFSSHAPSSFHAPPSPTPHSPPPAQLQKLIVFSVFVDVGEGGAMDVTYGSSTVPMELYAGDAASVAVLVLQVLFLVGIAWNIFEEAREMRHCQRVTGTLLSYFDSRWNWVDLASLALQLTGIALW